MLKIPKKTLAVIAKVVLAVLGVLHLNSPNRIVVALSPLFTTAAGAITALIAHYLPVIGSHFTTPELTGLFFSGALLAATHLLSWLKGWQAHETPKLAPLAVGVGPAPSPPVVVNVAPASGSATVQVTPKVEAQEVAASEPAPAAPPAAETLEGHTEVPAPEPGVSTPEHEVGRI